MSSSVTRGSEVVGHPQAVPQDGPVSIQSGLGHASMPQSSQSGPVQKFTQGQPVALGTTQIMIGIYSFSSGISLALAGEKYTVLAGVPFWTAVAFIISGSLSVAASKDPNKCLAKTTLAFNIVSALSAGIGIFIYAVDLVFFRLFYFNECDSILIEKKDPMCLELQERLVLLNYSVKAQLILFCLLELCIAISLAAFGCKTVRHDDFSYQPVIMQQISVYQGDNMTAPLILPGADNSSH